MPSRILREGINSSELVEQLSPMAELLYRRVMSIVDDFGRYPANPTLIRSAAWPLVPDKFTNEQIEGWLRECSQIGLIKLYSVGPKSFFEIWNFNQQKRSKKSKWPDPPGMLSKCEAIDKQMPSKCEADAKQLQSESTPLTSDSILDTRYSIHDIRTSSSEEKSEVCPEPIQSYSTVKFNHDVKFGELWRTYPAKGRVKIEDAKRWYVEVLELDPPRIHAQIMQSILPGGKWAVSDMWAKGFVSALPEFLRNRRWLEDPIPFDPSKIPKAINGRGAVIEAAKRTLEEVDLSDVERAY